VERVRDGSLDRVLPAVQTRRLLSTRATRLGTNIDALQGGAATCAEQGSTLIPSNVPGSRLKWERQI
jgi:hypothetical protein